MDKMHHRRDWRPTHHQTERRASDESDGLSWRHHLDRLHKNKTVRTHVRCWLLGLISFGPIR